jgi:hypothetical protein
MHFRPVTVLCVVLVAALVSAEAAWGAPPSNDAFAGAKVIFSLPFSETSDTTQATVDPTDLQVATACSADRTHVSATTWYAFTPSANQIVSVDTSGSNYFAVARVVTGTPGDFSPVYCGFQDGPSFVARAGHTYYLNAVSIGGSGGTLRLSLTGAPAPAFLDQSFTTPANLSSAINDCCAYVGQTFTAGRTGVLLGINVDVSGQNTSLPLHVAIRGVDSFGLPSSTVLGETVLGSSSAPLTQLITFPQSVRVTAGARYAIVVNYQGAPPQGPPNALGSWTGAVGDAYRAGGGVFSFNGGVTWSSADEGFDSHFQTYVERRPTSIDQCKKGGWQQFPGFKNQGQCVAFVNRGS